MNTKSLVNEVENAFRTGLPAVLGPVFEAREEQIEMARAVATAIETDRIDVIEAETGLGKTLAYLIPLVVHCSRTGARAVVSTYTKNLQSQLAEKDLSLAAQAAGRVGSAAGEVTGAVLMGRANYACRRRIGSVLDTSAKRGRAQAGDPPPADPAMSGWLETVRGSGTGELDWIPGATQFLTGGVRHKIACPSREAACVGCRFRDDCYLFRARRRALEAQLVVTNHALLFSNVMAAGALLGPFDILVVDEAHHLDDVATDFFSISFSPRSIRGAHHSIYTPDYEETMRYVRAMIVAESADEAALVDRLWASFHDEMDAADKETASLFAVLRRNAASLERRSNGVDARGNSNEPAVYMEGSPLFYDTESARADISRALARMEETADEILDIVDGHESLAESSATAAVRAIRETAAETRVEFDFLIAGSADDHVFYVQFDGASDAFGVSALAASPVDVSTRLGVALEEGSRASVLTSATLSVEGDFAFTLERLGLADSARAGTRRFDSPFDMDKNRVVLLPEHIPDPGAESFLRESAGLIAETAAASGRRVLVLCTARSQVASLQRLLSSSRGEAAELFAQTDGASREDLLERFKSSRCGILIGLASFWEGIDLPGDALEIVVILKLPFLVPTEPVTQARSRRMAEAGENAFEKLFIPDVVLRLRQGMGRLIRTSRDRGAVLLLDRRLWHSRYGEFILRAVTNGSVRCRDQSSTIEHVKAYFGQS